MTPARIRLRHFSRDRLDLEIGFCANGLRLRGERFDAVHVAVWLLQRLIARVGRRAMRGCSLDEIADLAQTALPQAAHASRRFALAPGATTVRRLPESPPLASPAAVVTVYTGGAEIPGDEAYSSRDLLLTSFAGREEAKDLPLPALESAQPLVALAAAFVMRTLEKGDRVRRYLHFTSLLAAGIAANRAPVPGQSLFDIGNAACTTLAATACIYYGTDREEGRLMPGPQAADFAAACPASAREAAAALRDWLDDLDDDTVTAVGEIIFGRLGVSMAKMSGHQMLLAEEALQDLVARCGPSCRALFADPALASPGANFHRMLLDAMPWPSIA